MPAALAAAVVLGGGTPICALAADSAQPVDELQEVFVTGIRASIEQSIEIKQQSNDIVEVVSAEDIGKLPDTSIAQSLARLPGLTVQRSGANDSSISIRGFGPDFNGTLLNGRNQASTGDSRAIEFDQYPAELISGAVVYKTNNPGVVGQGIAGTVDMQTIRPLEYGKRALAFDVRGVENSNGNLGGEFSDRQYRASVAYVGQYLDNTLGFAIGFSRVDLPVRQAQTSNYGPYKPNCEGYPCLRGVGKDVMVPNGDQTNTIVGMDKRDGVVATLEWKPNDAYASTLDFYYTNRTQDTQAGFLSVNWTPPGTFTNDTVVDNVLTGGTVTGLNPIVGISQDVIRDQVVAAGWNNKYTVGNWTLVGDLSYSRAMRDENRLLTYGAYTRANPRYGDTLTFNIPPGGAPSYVWGNDYNDPSQVLATHSPYGDGYASFPHVTDELKSVRFDVSHPLQGWVSAFLAGINYDDRAKVKRQPETSLSASTSGAIQLPSSDLLPSLNNGYASSPPILNWNVPAVIAAYYKPFVASTTAYNYLVGNDWEVDEKLTTLYARGNLDHDLSSNVKLRGNFGVQVIHAQQESSANFWNGALNNGKGGAAPASDGTSYTDVLPAANFVFEMPHQQAVRFSVAREIMRPRMDQLADTFSYGVDQSTGVPGASGGNPKLAPWRSNSVDLTYEKYFENRAYLSVAGFYKKLTTYIYNLGENYDFSALNGQIPAGYLGSGVTPKQFGIFNQFYNGKGGRVDGFEIALSLPGELLTDHLSGFGLLTSVSETDSSITIAGNVGGLPQTKVALPGLSKTVWQATLYYEKDGFSARIATRYRSNYIGEIYGFDDQRQLEAVRHEQISDFQTGYEFGDGRMKGLSLIFQINNISNEPYIDSAGKESQVGQYQAYGRVYFLGAKYKL